MAPNAALGVGMEENTHTHYIFARNKTGKKISFLKMEKLQKCIAKLAKLLPKDSDGKRQEICSLLLIL